MLSFIDILPPVLNTICTVLSLFILKSFSSAHCTNVLISLCTELPEYYTCIQTAVARGLGLPAGQLAGHQNDATSKHTLLFQFSFRVDGHVHRRTFAKWKH